MTARDSIDESMNDGVMMSVIGSCLLLAAVGSSHRGWHAVWPVANKHPVQRPVQDFDPESQLEVMGVAGVSVGLGFNFLHLKSVMTAPPYQADPPNGLSARILALGVGQTLGMLVRLVALIGHGSHGSIILASGERAW